MCDAWRTIKTNEVTSATTPQRQIVRQYNPFRYRGYYYDTQTSLYYLQSRYYDPSTGRFINADGYISTGTGLLGYNMYAYCNNNPVMNVDPEGEFWENAYNYDGTYSLHDNMRHRNHMRQMKKRGFVFHEQILVYKPIVTDGFGIEKNKNIDYSVKLGGEIYLFTGGWEGENWDISLLDFGVLGAELEVSPVSFNVKISASIWSPSYTFEVLGFDITLQYNLGVEIGLKMGSEDFEASSGGFSIGISW